MKNQIDEENSETENIGSDDIYNLVDIHNLIDTPGDLSEENDKIKVKIMDDLSKEVSQVAHKNMV